MTTNTYCSTNILDLPLLSIVKRIDNQIKCFNKNLKIMKSLRNSVQLIGRLGQDPEVINLTSGKKLTKFSLATNESYRDAKGEKVSETQWHNIVAWEKKADFVSEYLKKGMEIALEGKLVHRDYETSAGEKRTATEINLNDVVMVGSKS